MEGVMRASSPHQGKGGNPFGSPQVSFEPLADYRVRYPECPARGKRPVSLRRPGVAAKKHTVDIEKAQKRLDVLALALIEWLNWQHVDKATANFQLLPGEFGGESDGRTKVLETGKFALGVALNTVAREEGLFAPYLIIDKYALVPVRALAR